MDKDVFKNMSPKDRADNLQAMAHSTEETKYFKALTQEELDLKRETLTDNEIKLSRLEIEKKNFVADIKKKVDPIIKEKSSLISAIETRHEEIEGVLYHVDDQDEGLMYSFDANGEFISSRRLKPDERLGSMFNINQKQAQ
ncbi:hypothetical protein EGI16_03615 [Chryseobacterium sp. G0240]|uniref:hypothetical protein n=1 Tax=Chryseobacterium sp. G0240 TaxID=2487066 RepID=UPI000F446A26|nr:hypothetical protein [Chryseobacterium sp. G0240]ROI05486.1 hypothetical protein EGI16_03615 [Chryseobacterium sp. G0240]